MMFTLLAVITLIGISVSPVLADVEIPTRFLPLKWITLLRCTPGPRGASGCNFPISTLISVLLPNVLILAGVIFFLLILGGGFMLIHGAGKESSAQDKAKAQGAITYGVIGFLLVVAAYFILQMVEVITGIKFINPSAIP